MRGAPLARSMPAPQRLARSRERAEEHLHDVRHQAAACDPPVAGALCDSNDSPPRGSTAAARDLAALDLGLTRPFLAYAAHVSTGRVDPKALPADWHVRRTRGDLVSFLADAVRAHRVRETLERLPPRDPRYVRLRDALARY